MFGWAVPTLPYPFSSWACLALDSREASYTWQTQVQILALPLNKLRDLGKAIFASLNCFLLPGRVCLSKLRGLNEVMHVEMSGL